MQYNGATDSTQYILVHDILTFVNAFIYITNENLYTYTFICTNEYQHKPEFSQTY